ncbi:hypothetical protein K0B96_14935 [Horticoccus luteus]|uniref:Tetratricopeptide repeat protein n=1 Tax=Horticoccus luteus TaxID=2862869 RepID=A0A8F9XJE3_9BACT|nr:hypothetical protein [Horticoccus luteus]QYM78578.1 hypothetical protein K0B96_14935 [Horticoccus luteus]
MAFAVALAGIAGYLILTVSVWLFVRFHSGFSDATLTDYLTLPLRWDAYREKRGRWEIRHGLRLFAEGKVRDALPRLRAGVARVPRDVEARLTLARGYAIGRRLDLSEAILLDGASYVGDDPRYVGEVLEFLFFRQEDDKALAFCARELANYPHLNEETRTLLQRGAATACFFRGHFDAAEDWLQRGGHPLDPVSRLLTAQIEWERGYPALAITQLESLLADAPPAADAYDLLVNYLVEQRRFGDVQRISIQQQVAQPHRARPRVDYLLACERLGERRRVDTETASILAEFAADNDGAASLASFAAQNGNVPLAAALVQRRTALGLDAVPARFALAEALTKIHDFKAAQVELQQLAAPATLLPSQDALLLGLEAVVAAGLGDSGGVQLHLTAFLSHPAVRADNVVAVAVRLQEQGASNYARSALETAVHLDPQNQFALMHLIDLDVQNTNLAALPSNLRSYLQTRKPSPTVLAAARTKLSSDAFLFSADRTATLELLRDAAPRSSAPRG